MDRIQLLGRLFITGNIEAKTGLHIGGSNNTFSIGGVDNPVILNPMNQQPYIPGSSLRGKMRSLTTKYLGLSLKKMGRISMHLPNTEEYAESPVGHLYGVPAEDYNLPTRLIVRDVALRPESAERLRNARTDLPYTEVKTEVSIDRITSSANPRPLERVPAGAVFGPMELIVNLYRAEDVELIRTLADGMVLLEGDYLGGSGSRGSGKVAFSELYIQLVPRGVDYQLDSIWYANLQALVADLDNIIQGISETLIK